MNKVIHVLILGVFGIACWCLWAILTVMDHTAQHAFNGAALPAFTAQPAAQTIATGSTVVLAATVTGATSFQWSLNGVPLFGATSATLALANVACAQESNLVRNASFEEFGGTDAKNQSFSNWLSHVWSGQCELRAGALWCAGERGPAHRIPEPPAVMHDPHLHRTWRPRPDAA